MSIITKASVDIPLDKSNEIRLVRVAHELWDEGTFFPGAINADTNEIWFTLILGGLLDVRIGDEPTGQFGYGYLHVTRHAHDRNDSLGVSEGHDAELLMIVLTGDQLSKRTSSFIDDHTAMYRLAGTGLVEQIMRTGLRLVERGQEYMSQSCRQTFSEFFLTCLEQSLITSSQPRPYNVKHYERCLDIIATWPPKELTVNGIADALSVNRSSLSRTFKQYHGASLSGALRARRLSFAARCLRDTNESLEQIADAAGYSDAFALSRAFRSQFGKPPSQFRANNQYLD